MEVLDDRDNNDDEQTLQEYIATLSVEDTHECKSSRNTSNERGVAL
jgi:hypothetical protein